METNAFQWKRVGMLFSLYYPVLKWQIAGYLCLAVVMTGLVAVGNSFGYAIIPLTLCSFVLGAAFYLAPISITRRDYRQVCALLPATAAEKMAFLLLYFFIGCYLMLNGPLFAAHFIWPDHVPMYQNLNPQIQNIEISVFGYLSGVITALGIVTVALWTLVVGKTSRAALVFAAVVAVTVAQSIVGGVCGMIYAFSHLDEMELLANDGDISSVANLVEFAWKVGLIVSLAIVCVFMALLYKKLKHRGF